MDSASIGEDLCLTWPAFMQRLFCERAVLRGVGLQGCDEIIQEQFKMEKDGRRKGLDYTAWDAKHREEVEETIQALKSLPQVDKKVDKKDQKKGHKDDLDILECIEALKMDIHWMDGKLD